MRRCSFQFSGVVSPVLAARTGPPTCTPVTERQTPDCLNADPMVCQYESLGTQNTTQRSKLSSLIRKTLILIKGVKARINYDMYMTSVAIMNLTLNIKFGS